MRSVEASCHVYSIFKYGRYRCLTDYKIINEGKIFRGEIELPFTIGTKGGATKSNKIYQLNFEILGKPTTWELALIVSSVGLAQNLAALKALVTVGI